MPLLRWFLLIGVVVGLGLLQVAQRNAIFLQGYAVGERMVKAHRESTDVSWLKARLDSLSSPAHLSEAAEKHRLKLVAWSVLRQVPPAQSLVALKRNSADTEEGLGSLDGESAYSASSAAAEKTQVALSPSDD